MREFTSADGSSIHVVAVAQAKDAKQFIAAIAREQGWSPPEGAIDGNPGGSRYLVHEDDQGIRGVVKLILPHPGESLPILAVWPEIEAARMHDAAELSVLAISRRVRGHGHAFLPLAAEMWRCCSRVGISTLWAELEPRMVPAYARFGWPFEIVGELREFWGDPLYPCSMGIAAAREEFVVRARSSSRYAEAVRQAFRGE